MRLSVLVGVLVINLIPLRAQEDTLRSDKMTTSVKMLGLGHINILDTYLSPESYTGTDFHYLSHTTYDKIGSNISHQFVQQGSLAYLNERSLRANELFAMYQLSYGWHYNWFFMERRLNLKIGGLLQGHAGVLYNMRNSNNPIQAKLGVNLAPSAVVSCRFKVLNQSFMARYEAEVPLLGLMFSPNYGQSYYELFSNGNYDHNLVPTYIVNAPSFTQMFTIDFSLLKTTVRVGYLGIIDQSDVNHLKFHSYSHMLLLGVVKTFNLIHIRP